MLVIKSPLHSHFVIHSAPRRCSALDSAKFDCACTPTRCSRTVVHSVYLLSRKNKLTVWSPGGNRKTWSSPIPQNVKYRLNTSTSRSVNSSCPVNHNPINLRPLPTRFRDLTVSFINDLGYTNHLTLVVTNGHRENYVRLVSSL